jgi:hypothetical protein
MKNSKKKELFLESMAKAFNITEACLASGIGRRTYYGWLNTDPSFKKACEDVQESLLDHVESKVINAINKDSIEMIKWYLDHKGKSRGYGQSDQQTITGAITGAIEVSIIKKVIGGSPDAPTVV